MIQEKINQTCLSAETNQRCIVCSAKAFGYGPAGKLNSILRGLQNHVIHFLGTGTALEFFSREHFTGNVIACDVEDINEVRKTKDLLSEADMVLSVGNWPVLSVAMELGKRTAYVDTLFWMWPEVNQNLVNVDRYFIQNFINVPQKYSSFKSQLKNPVLVGPIVNDKLLKRGSNGNGREKNKLLVSLGGIESELLNVGVNTWYPHFIIQLLNEVLSDHKFSEVIITGGTSIQKINNINLNIPRAKLCSLSHDEFIRHLSESAFILTSPGLSTTYEAFYLKKPIVYLLPQNASNWMISKYLRENDIVRYSPHWSDYYVDLDVNAGNQQELNVKLVLEAIERGRHDSIVFSKFVNEYKSIILYLHDKKNRQFQANRQHYWLTTLNSESGLTTVMENINTLLYT